MYARTYVSVTLSIVHLRSRPGKISDPMCITQRWDDVFRAMEDREDSTAGPLQHMYLAESSAEASAERS